MVDFILIETNSKQIEVKKIRKIIDNKLSNKYLIFENLISNNIQDSFSNEQIEKLHKMALMFDILFVYFRKSDGNEIVDKFVYDVSKKNNLNLKKICIVDVIDDMVDYEMVFDTIIKNHNLECLQ